MRRIALHSHASCHTLNVPMGNSKTKHVIRLRAANGAGRRGARRFDGRRTGRGRSRRAWWLRTNGTTDRGPTGRGQDRCRARDEPAAGVGSNKFDGNARRNGLAGHRRIDRVEHQIRHQLTQRLRIALDSVRSGFARSGSPGSELQIDSGMKARGPHQAQHFFDQRRDMHPLANGGSGLAEARGIAASTTPSIGIAARPRRAIRRPRLAGNRGGAVRWPFARPWPRCAVDGPSTPQAGRASAAARCGEPAAGGRPIGPSCD